ncbi:MAG TPA: glycerophosphoryl diester phosphodiesterase membrane domain-containing protein [Allosphingosinicella sp.]
MTKLSISRAWDEAAAVLKRDAGTLYLIAFGLGTLPQLVAGALLPNGSASGSGILLALLMLASLAVGVAGSVAITALALGRENVVGRGLALGFRRMPSLFAASLLLLVAFLILIAVVGAVAGLTPENAFAAGGQPTPKATLALLIGLLAAVLIGARFLLTTPVAAAEGGNPIAILRRSWSLTAGNYGRLLLFLILLAVAGLVFLFAVMTVSGLIVALTLGPPQPGSTAGFVAGLIVAAANALFVLIFTVVMARVYAQLAGTSGAATAPGASDAGRDTGSGDA